MSLDDLVRCSWRKYDEFYVHGFFITWVIPFQLVFRKPKGSPVFAFVFIVVFYRISCYSDTRFSYFYSSVWVSPGCLHAMSMTVQSRSQWQKTLYMQSILSLAAILFSHHNIGLDGSYFTSLAALWRMKSILPCDLLLHYRDVVDFELWIAQSVGEIVAPVRAIIRKEAWICHSYLRACNLSSPMTTIQPNAISRNNK